MSLTKAQLEALNVSSFPNNNEGLITPEILRVYNSSSIAATVNQDVYTTESASFNSRIIAASGSTINTGSFATTGSNSFSGSQIITGSITSSLDIKVAGVKIGFGNPLGTSSIAIGTSTLLNNTGNANIAIGTQALQQNTTGGSNTALGFDALQQNTTGETNTGIGAAAGRDNITGVENVFVGWIAGVNANNTSNNVVIGARAGQKIQSSDNTIVGHQAAANLTSGSHNTIIGRKAAELITTASDNTIVGYAALGNGTTGNENTAVGYNALNVQTTAQHNTAVGADAGNTNTGDNNTFVGWTAGLATAGGGNNTVIGAYAGRNIKNNGNTVVGYYAGIDIKSGSANTFIGNSAGEKVSGSYNTFLGGYKGIGNESNVIALADGQENVRAIYNSGWVFTGSVDIQNTLTASLAQGYVLVGDSNNRTTLVATSSFGTSINTGSFATTGSNTFTGNQTIEGAIVSNITSSVIKLFSAGFVSGAVGLNITASNAISQSNLVLIGTPQLASSIFTGSIIISGSNNILTTGTRTNTIASTFRIGYIGGSGNIVGTIPQLNTGSLVSPTMNNNQLNGAVLLTFNTSSTLANPTFNTNQIVGTTQINHQSGSAAFSNNIVMSNGFSSTANTTTLSQNSTMTGNLVASFGSVSLNHNSSSILYSSNIGGGITVTNNYSSSVSTAVDNVSVQGNLFTGTGHTLLVSGSNTSNRRTFNHNIIVGSTNAISSELSGSTNGHLLSTAIIGQNLIVSASGTSTTAGGGAFFGRYNDTTAGLSDSQNVIFAVGGGTGTSARKTPLYITTGSAVFVSGSLLVTGSLSVSGSTTLSGSLKISASSDIVLNGTLTITGSNLNIDSSANITASAFTAIQGNTKAFSYQAASSGGVNGTFNTALGRDYLDIYQYQGQAYAFNMHLTSDQLNTYSGSQFAFQLQQNGNGVSIPGGGATYFAMVSASYSSSVGPGTEIPGLDVLGASLFLDMKAPSTFKQKVYLDKGLYVSASAGTSGPALTINTNGGDALSATGSVKITGSLEVNGSNLATLGSNTFTNTQIVSSSIYIAPNNNNNQLYLPSGSNKQTGTFVLNGGNPGTATISNSNVTANSLIFLTKQSNANSGNGTVSVTSKGSGTFSVTSDHNGDADEVAFMIINAS